MDFNKNKNKGDNNLNISKVLKSKNDFKNMKEIISKKNNQEDKDIKEKNQQTSSGLKISTNNKIYN